MMNDRTEWIEADGRGGFASGPVAGPRTRRYHALLLTASTPPTGRMVLVNGVDVFARTPQGTAALSCQRYQPGVLAPEPEAVVESFRAAPWPAWVYVLPDGTRIQQEIVVHRETGACLLVWTLLSTDSPVTLTVRPYFSGRDYHSMHHENGAFRFAPERRADTLIWRPYDGVPAICACTNGSYTQTGDWYRNFLYDVERERGLDDTEDLAAPGTWEFVLEAPRAEAVIVFTAGEPMDEAGSDADARQRALQIRIAERQRRERFDSPLARAADTYVVKRGQGSTIVAGYPWFTDWGRDTFVSLRGLCLGNGRLADARDILLEWSGAVSEGMLPNRFPDAGEAPEFNSVDASLWFVVAVHELLERASLDPALLTSTQQARLHQAVLAIVSGYAAGTRFGIRSDHDGLLAAGAPGFQLTWMDARVGDRVITPRIGKPVEVEALWLNALRIASHLDGTWTYLLARARASFRERFWNADRGCLFDVVDVDHVPGTADPTLRPNQILAVGGLPFQALEGEQARAVVECVERELVTPTGLRSLARSEPGYAGRYEGGPSIRDSVYHQGTVWPWLMGPFIEAWLRVRGDAPGLRNEARRRFLDPLVAALDPGGQGHFPEITDAEPPFNARGCPFQAWSLAEVLRIDAVLRAPETLRTRKSRTVSAAPMRDEAAPHL